MSNLEEAEQYVRIKTKRIVSLTTLIMIIIFILFLLSFYFLNILINNMGITSWISIAVYILYLSFLLIIQLVLSPWIMAYSIGVRYIADDEFIWLKKTLDNALLNMQIPSFKIAIFPDRSQRILIFGNFNRITLGISEGLIVRPELTLNFIITEVKNFNFNRVILMTFLSSIPLTASVIASIILGERNIISPYFKTPDKVAQKMLSLAGLRPNEIVYDLGSGEKDSRTLPGR